MREILVHLNVEVPDADERSADGISAAILHTLEHGFSSTGPLQVGDLHISCPLAEEI